MTAQVQIQVHATSVTDAVEQLYALAANQVLANSQLQITAALNIVVIPKKAAVAANPSPVPPAGSPPAAPPSAETVAPVTAAPSNEPTPSTGGAAPSPAPTAASGEVPKRRGRPPKDPNAPPAPPKPKAPDPVPDLKDVPSAAPPVAAKITEADVLAALHAVANSKPGEEGFKLAEHCLNRFGARKRSELKQDQFAEFIELTKQAIATGTV